MKQKVVIIGHGFTSRLSVIRSVAQIGCEVTVVVMTWHRHGGNSLDTRKPIDCHSKYVNHVFYTFAKDGEGLIQLLLNHCTDVHQKVIIIPDSDFSAAVINDNKDRLSDFFLFPHIIHEPNSFRYWMNKENQKLLANDVGLNYAKSFSIQVNSGKYTIPEGVIYPCFTKPAITISGGKQYFRICENEEQLKDLLDYVGSIEDVIILAEEYIDIQDEYAILGFSDGNEVVIPGVVQFIENCKSHFGIAMKGKIIPTLGFDSLLERFKDFVLRMGFVGLFDIDFFYDGNKWWFGEMNLRFGGSGYAVTKMGVNLPAMLVKTLTGVSIEDTQKKITESSVYVNERMVMDDWYKGFITTKEYHQSIHTAAISFVCDEEDEGPQKALKAEFYRMYLKKIIKSILKWMRIR